MSGGTTFLSVAVGRTYELVFARTYRRATKLAAVGRGPAGRNDTGRPWRPYTMKLSPQPQAPLALGFSNTKPAVKSSSRQSITLPIK